MDKSGGSLHHCYKKGHYSYMCRSPVHIQRNNAIMHLNVEVDSDTPEDPSDKVMDFHFLNLEDGNEAHSFLNL